MRETALRAGKVPPAMSKRKRQAAPEEGCPYCSHTYTVRDGLSSKTDPDGERCVSHEGPVPGSETSDFIVECCRLVTTVLQAVQHSDHRCRQRRTLLPYDPVADDLASAFIAHLQAAPAQVPVSGEDAALPQLPQVQG